MVLICVFSLYYWDSMVFHSWLFVSIKWSSKIRIWTNIGIYRVFSWEFDWTWEMLGFHEENSRSKHRDGTNVRRAVRWARVRRRMARNLRKTPKKVRTQLARMGVLCIYIMVDISIVNGIINQLITGGHHLVYIHIKYFSWELLRNLMSPWNHGISKLAAWRHPAHPAAWKLAAGVSLIVRCMWLHGATWCNPTPSDLVNIALKTDGPGCVFRTSSMVFRINMYQWYTPWQVMCWFASFCIGREELPQRRQHLWWGGGRR